MVHPGHLWRVHRNNSTVLERTLVPLLSLDEDICAGRDTSPAWVGVTTKNFLTENWCVEAANWKTLAWLHRTSRCLSLILTGNQQLWTDLHGDKVRTGLQHFKGKKTQQVQEKRCWRKIETSADRPALKFHLCTLQSGVPVPHKDLQPQQMLFLTGHSQHNSMILG